MADLLSIVETYASFGDHTSGSSADVATRDWLRDLLLERDASVDVETFTLLQSCAESEVRIDGELVESWTLPYSYEGTIATSTVARSSNDVLGPAALAGLDDARRENAAADALVIATTGDFGHDGRLFAINRPSSLALGVPTFFVAGRHSEALAGASVSVEARALSRTGRCRNLIGEWGDPADAPIIITTPLNGWFTCAGERGSGIAVAIELATRLAEHRSVRLLMTGGHELEGLGVEHHLRLNDGDFATVIHVGASVAATGVGGTGLTDNVQIAIRTPDAEPAAIAERLALSGHPVVQPDRGESAWRGESVSWQKRTRTLVSIAGASPLFHTPDDVLPAATNEALLTQVLEAFHEAALLL